MLVTALPRDTFLTGYFVYEPGEKVAFWEPSQQGKSELLWQMLQIAMIRHPELDVATLMPKARDPATSKWAPRLGFKVLDGWPPPARLPFQEKPAGYVCWPKHPVNLPVKEKRAVIAAQLRKCISQQFIKGRSITVADDVHNLVLIGLNPEIEEHLTLGGGPQAGLWIAGQKASGTAEARLTTFARNTPEHIILGHDPMAANRKWFDEIGGIDPGQVSRIVAGLRKHRIYTPGGYKNISEKLYIRKDGPYMCIIGP